MRKGYEDEGRVDASVSERPWYGWTRTAHQYRPRSATELQLLREGVEDPDGHRTSICINFYGFKTKGPTEFLNSVRG